MSIADGTRETPTQRTALERFWLVFFGIVAAVQIVALVGAGGAAAVHALRPDAPIFIHADDDDDAQAMASGPTAYTKAITVSNAATTALRFSATSVANNGECTVETSGLQVFIVSPTATTTTDGEGPYCDTCNNGAHFSIGGLDYARTSAGSGTVRCRFYDAPRGAASGGGGGMARGLADTLYCKLTGCTMSGTLTLSGVATDITAASGEDLTLRGGATSGSVQLQSQDNATDILDPSGSVRGRFVTRDGNAELYIQQGTSGGAVLLTSASSVIGASGTIADNSTAFMVAEGINTATGSTTPLLRVTGAGVITPTPTAALGIGGTPDTTRQPMASGTSCRMSAGSAGQSWTPSETNAVPGSFVCCTNTGANDITMADLDGQYEGPGSVVGQWDTVCMEYVTDRWVERSFSNNEP